MMSEVSSLARCCTFSFLSSFPYLFVIKISEFNSVCSLKIGDDGKDKIKIFMLFVLRWLFADNLSSNKSFPQFNFSGIPLFNFFASISQLGVSYSKLSRIFFIKNVSIPRIKFFKRASPERFIPFAFCFAIFHEFLFSFKSFFLFLSLFYVFAEWSINKMWIHKVEGLSHHALCVCVCMCVQFYLSTNTKFPFPFSFIDMWVRRVIAISWKELGFSILSY